MISRFTSFIDHTHPLAASFGATWDISRPKTERHITKVTQRAVKSKLDTDKRNTLCSNLSVLEGKWPPSRGVRPEANDYVAHLSLSRRLDHRVVHARMQFGLP